MKSDTRNAVIVAVVIFVVLAHSVRLLRQDAQESAKEYKRLLKECDGRGGYLRKSESEVCLKPGSEIEIK